MVQLLTFGGPELVSGTLPGRRPLVLAAYLAVEGRQPRRRLAELFCDGNRDPLNQLSVNLTRLRRQLRAVGAEGALRADAASVAVDLVTDHRRFLDVLELGDLARAVELHRGPFLAQAHSGLGEELAAWVVATREALIGRLQAAAAAEARRLVAAGRESEAAALAESAYRAAGPGGSDPRHLDALHAVIVQAGGALAGELLAESRALGGERPRFVAREQAVDPRRAPTNLALQAGLVVGRERERLELAALMRRREARIVTLLGEGGCGKSRLALRVAADRHASDDYPGGVVVVSADGSAALDELERRFSAALAAGGVCEAASVADALPRLRRLRLLLVLDDVGGSEPALAAAAAFVARLRDALPDLRALVTAGRRLGLPDEHVYHVGGLGHAGADLFVKRVEALQPGRKLTAADVEGARRLADVVGGDPLAITLAAGLASALSTSDVCALVEREPRALGELRGVPARLRSPAARFGHALAELSGDARTALLQLSYFEPGFSREAALGVADAPPLALVELSEASLLSAGADGRLRLSPLTRRLALYELAAAPGLHAATAAAHLAYYAALPMRHYQAAFGPDQAAVQRLLADELPNSLLAFRHAAEVGAAAAMRPIALGCYALYARLGRFHEAIALLGEGLVALEGVGVAAPGPAAAARQATVGWLLALSANHLSWLGRVDEARDHAERALAELLPLSDGAGARQAYLALVTCSVARRDAEGAARYYDLAKAAHPQEYAGAMGDGDGLVLLLAGDWAAAAEALRRSVAVHRQQGNVGQEAVTHFRLAGAEFRRGELALARRSFERALRLTQGVYPYYEHASRLGLARTLAAIGGPSGARARRLEQDAAGAPPDLARAAGELLASIGMEPGVAVVGAGADGSPVPRGPRVARAVYP